MSESGILPVSGVVITFNEEERILDCILSLQRVCAEVIVVDSNSTDKTPEICKKAGARVVQHHWQGFSATKNFANSLATQPFILSLDADERLSPALIRELQRKQLQQNTAYAFNRRNYYRGVPVRFCGWYPDTKVRLFPKDKAVWSGEYVHETLKLEQEIKTIRMRSDILHYTIRNTAEHRRTIEKYSDLAAKDWTQRHSKPSFLKPYFSYTAMFIKKYLLQLGFLDGANGLYISHFSALSRYLKYRKARNINNSAS